MNEKWLAYRKQYRFLNMALFTLFQQNVYNRIIMWLGDKRITT